MVCDRQWQVAKQHTLVIDGLLQAAKLLTLVIDGWRQAAKWHTLVSSITFLGLRQPPIKSETSALWRRESAQCARSLILLDKWGVTI